MTSSSLTALDCDVAVVGAGITGLTAAYLAHRAGARVKIFEGGGIGGVIRTEHKDGFTLESGPNVFVARPHLIELIEMLDLESSIIFPNVPAKPRQLVLVDGKLEEIPKGPLGGLTTPLLEWSAKLRALWSLITNKYPGNIKKDLSVAALFLPLIGKRGLDRILEPALRGIYGGDCHNLSAEFLFPDLFARIVSSGKIRGSRQSKSPKVFTLRDGNSSLVKRLVESLPDGTVIRSAVLALGKNNDHFTVVTGDGRTATASSIVLTAGNGVTGLISGFDAQLAGELRAIPGVGLEVLHFSVTKLFPELKNAFGVLLPSDAPGRVLGVMCSSDMFPQMAPTGEHLLTVCLRPTTDVDKVDETKLIKEVSEVLNKISPSNPRLLKQTVWRYALPKYRVGHATLVKRARELETRVPGLFLVGRDIGKPGVSDRVAAAFEWIERWKKWQAAQGAIAQDQSVQTSAPNVETTAKECVVS